MSTSKLNVRSGETTTYIVGEAAMSELRDSHTLAELLNRQASRRPEATALIYGDRRTPYAALARHASQVANGLAGLGIRRHYRIGYLGNSDLYFERLFGVGVGSMCPTGRGLRRLGQCHADLSRPTRGKRLAVVIRPAACQFDSFL
jgi:hypothetical protein